jgi:23S rRNA pseudouridine2605 synthase
MNDDRKKPTRNPGGKPAGRPARSGDAPRSGTGKPYRTDGPKKPFAKRAEGASASGPKRDFKRDDRPRDGGEGRSERPDFKAGPRPERKPYEKRERSGPDRAPGADRADGGNRFQKRDSAPRSAGMKSHEGQRRSYGTKSHDEVAKRPFRKPAEAGEEVPGERIAKRLARAGIASRRDAEDLIAAGRVRVNGQKLASPAFNVLPEDEIEVDGTAIPAIERTRLFLFHKPAGVVTTNRDPEGRKTVFDVLPAELPRLMTVGRLDINTEGLLLLTNDGGLSRVLELPATGWLRRYRVRVHGKVDEKMLPGLKDGMAVDGVFYGSIEATLDREQGTNAWMTIGLREGKNREVKNILGALGLEVTRLIRMSYGPFQLGDLPEGHVQEVKGKLLREQLGERLIEESGANFEAPIVNTFSNEPVKRTPAPREEMPERPKPARDGIGSRMSEGGLIKNRKRRENSRDEALGKLSTRPDKPKFERGERPERPKLERGERPDGPRKFGDRPDRNATFAAKPGAKPRAGGRPEREQKPIDPPSQRKANVWMAPGARPIGTGRAAAEKAEVEAKRAAKKTYGKPGGKPAFGKTRNDKPGGDRPRGGDGPSKGPRSGGRNADRRR